MISYDFEFLFRSIIFGGILFVQKYPPKMPILKVHQQHQPGSPGSRQTQGTTSWPENGGYQGIVGYPHVPTYEPGSKLPMLGMVISPLIGIVIKGSLDEKLPSYEVLKMLKE